MMSADQTPEKLERLVSELMKLPRETEWVEFKVNNTKPDEIGEYVSALSNSAAQTGKTEGYLVWGIEDSTHRPVGTNFSPLSEKVGNEELMNWLLDLSVTGTGPMIEIFEGRVEITSPGVPLIRPERFLDNPPRSRNEGLADAALRGMRRAR